MGGKGGGGERGEVGEGRKEEEEGRGKGEGGGFMGSYRLDFFKHTPSPGHYSKTLLGLHKSLCENGHFIRTAKNLCQ